MINDKNYLGHRSFDRGTEILFLAYSTADIIAPNIHRMEILAAISAIVVAFRFIPAKEAPTRELSGRRFRAGCGGTSSAVACLVKYTRRSDYDSGS